jgi:dipeptidyl aminopeptidase/acylaminoacyl peptidase
MRKLRILIAAIVGASASIAIAQPPPAEAYGRLPAIGSAALSPDGTRVAVALGFEFQSAKPDSELTALRIINVDTGKVEHTLARPPGNSMRNVGWADDRRPFYILSESTSLTKEYSKQELTRIRNQRTEYARTYVLSLDTGKVTPLMQSSEFRNYGSLTNLYAPIEGDPGFGRMIAGGGYFGVGGGGRVSVFRVNLDNGSASVVASAEEHFAGFMLDERGDVVGRTEINQHRDRWRLYVYDGGKERLLLDQVSDMGEPLRLYGLLADGRIAAVDPHEEGSRDTLLAIDRKTGESISLYKTGGTDIFPIRDPWTHLVVGASWTEDLPQQHFFDKQLQDVHDAVASHFKDGYSVLESSSRDHKRFLVFGEHAGDAGAYYIYEPEADKFRSIGKVYPSLKSSEDLGDRRAIRFRARDGTSVPAYLTLPAGVEPKRLPLVLLVHGGPHARDTFVFDWWSSFLASRGYAVLQVNFRGSTGYGYDWFNAGRGNWGDGVMQTDVEDGADALVKNGTVDAARVCIMGASYGGYAALAGATLTPDRYACAVSVNGLSDPVQQLIDVTNYDRRSYNAEWWRRSMGDDVKHLRKVSPVEHVEDVRSPILVIHGNEDSVLAAGDSRAYSAKLQRAGKQVRYVELKGDDHWLSAASTRTLMLREIETFLAAQLGPKTDAAVASPATGSVK